MFLFINIFFFQSLPKVVRINLNMYTLLKRMRYERDNNFKEFWPFSSLIQNFDKWQPQNSAFYLLCPQLYSFLFFSFPPRRNRCFQSSVVGLLWESFSFGLTRFFYRRVIFNPIELVEKIISIDRCTPQPGLEFFKRSPFCSRFRCEILDGFVKFICA